MDGNRTRYFYGTHHLVRPVQRVALAIINSLDFLVQQTKASNVSTTFKRPKKESAKPTIEY